MTIDRPAPLTPEEFAALLDLAFGAPRRKIASIVLAKLVVLRYIDMTASGPVVTQKRTYCERGTNRVRCSHNH